MSWKWMPEAISSVKVSDGRTTSFGQWPLFMRVLEDVPYAAVLPATHATPNHTSQFPSAAVAIAVRIPQTYC